MNMTPTTAYIVQQSHPETKKHSFCNYIGVYYNISILKSNYRAPAIAMSESNILFRVMELPMELHAHILDNLGFPEDIMLKMTSRHFWNTMKPLSHTELLQAEETDYARCRSLLACKDCLRLRPSIEFADKMKIGKRSPGAHGSAIRFCIDCGLNPQPGTTRYIPGQRIVVKGKVFVRCIDCNDFKEGNTTLNCGNCWDRDENILSKKRQSECRIHERNLQC